MKKIAVMSGKGGVGKSTVAANLAFELALKGNKVGVFDSDFHGPSIPQMLGGKKDIRSIKKDSIEPVEVNSNLKVISMEFLLPKKDSAVIWRGPLKMKAIKEFKETVDWGDIDYLIIDLPPGTGDEPLSIAQQFDDLEGSIIVTTPQEVAVQAVRRSIDFSRKIGMKVLGVVENMSTLTCPNCGENLDVFGSGGGKKMAEELGINFLGSIPLDPQIMESGEVGRSLMEIESDSSKAFKDIVENLKKEMGE